MATIMPQTELLKKAAAWIAEQRSEHPAKDLYSIFDEAGMRFNLPPKDALALERLFTQQTEEQI